MRKTSTPRRNVRSNNWRLAPGFLRSQSLESVRQDALVDCVYFVRNDLRDSISPHVATVPDVTAVGDCLPGVTGASFASGQRNSPPRPRHAGRGFPLFSCSAVECPTNGAARDLAAVWQSYEQLRGTSRDNDQFGPCRRPP